MIHRISIQGYRSLRDFELRLSPRITVVQGLNGVGKSNLYKGLRLFSSLATAQFAEQIASEGGTSSCFWAGDDRKKGEMRVINLNLDAIEYRWKISFGLVPTTPGDPTFFRTDPDLKSETISTESTTLSRSMVHEGVKGSPTESLLTIIRGSDEYSEVSRVREDIASWRFYDNIRTDELSPAREPSARFWSPVLNQDASNLPSVIH